MTVRWSGPLPSTCVGPIAGQWDFREQICDSGHISMLELKMMSMGFALKSKLFF